MSALEEPNEYLLRKSNELTENLRTLEESYFTLKPTI